MNPKTPVNREREIFEQALDLASAEERMGFLTGACGGDAALLERQLGLLRANEGAGAFLPEAPQLAATVKYHPPGGRGRSPRLAHQPL